MLWLPSRGMNSWAVSFKPESGKQACFLIWTYCVGCLCQEYSNWCFHYRILIALNEYEWIVSGSVEQWIKCKPVLSCSVVFLLIFYAHRWDLLGSRFPENVVLQISFIWLSSLPFFFFPQGTCVKAWDWGKSREEGNGVVIAACFPWIRILMFGLRMVPWGNSMAQQRLMNSVSLGKWQSSLGCRSYRMRGLC